MLKIATPARLLTGGSPITARRLHGVDLARDPRERFDEPHRIDLDRDRRAVDREGGPDDRLWRRFAYIDFDALRRPPASGWLRWDGAAWVPMSRRSGAPGREDSPC